jgi:hypothetical protein
MSSTLSLEAHEWDAFSVPHCVRLVGEEQHLLDAGSISVATTLRTRVRVEETGDELSLRFGGGPRDQDGLWQAGEEAAAEFAAPWTKAMRDLLVADASDLDGLDIEVDFGPLWRVCPPAVLTASPAVSVALVVAATAHRGEGRRLTQMELAEAACRLHQAATDPGHASVDRFYSDVLVSLVGGAGYVEPGGERMNVQQILPPESLLLVLAPGIEESRAAHQRDEGVRRARLRAQEAGGDVAQPGDVGLSALFALAGSVLKEEEVTVLYGLMRVRQMTDGLLEYVGEPSVDNDRLAEICDEESAVLTAYFGFPGSSYDRVRAAAHRAGALGAKLTWAFGAYPAAIVVAPGRRRDVGEALTNTFPGIYCLLADMDPAGLLRAADEEAAAGGEF